MSFSVVERGSVRLKSGRAASDLKDGGGTFRLRETEPRSTTYFLFDRVLFVSGPERFRG